MQCIEALQGDAVLEDGYFAVAVLFVAGLFARGNGENLVDELRYNFLHGTTLDELSGREVDPVGLILGEGRVGGDLHGGYEGTEGCASTGCEQDDVTAAGGQCRRSYEVVAWSRQQIKTISGETVAIFHNATDGSLAALLRATQSLVLEGGNAAGLIAW